MVNQDHVFKKVFNGVLLKSRATRIFKKSHICPKMPKGTFSRDPPRIMFCTYTRITCHFGLDKPINQQPLQKHTSSAFCICRFGDWNFSYTATLATKTFRLLPLWRVLLTRFFEPWDRFQVSHFRPVVMEIEIGGRSEKSLGGQESAAVDQECMGSNASSCSFALSFPIRLPFFCQNLSHVGGSE